MRSTHFSDGETYHIFNRGIDRKQIFLHPGQYRRFLQTMIQIMEAGSATKRPGGFVDGIRRTDTEPAVASRGLAASVSIIAYCLMPDHYHLILTQRSEGGITKLMHHLNTSYTMYFNKNHMRRGPLFESAFRAKRIDGDAKLLEISRYIHLNPVIARLSDTPSAYPWSSYGEYRIDLADTICDKEEILKLYQTSNAREQYDAYVTDPSAYTELLRVIKLSNNDEDALYI